MNINKENNKILVIHGPNMNLIGQRDLKENNMLTLDKINSHIRKHIRNKNIKIKILQTHNESKAISYIQNNRKKINGLILTPCMWNNNGFILNELLDLIKLKYVNINIDQEANNKLFLSGKTIYNNNILLSFEQALDYLHESKNIN